MTDKKQGHQQDPATESGDVAGLFRHIRDLKQTIANLENKLYTYEKRNNDSQLGNEQPADH
jgi:hypothetical protein